MDAAMAQRADLVSGDRLGGRLGLRSPGAGWFLVQRAGARKWDRVRALLELRGREALWGQRFVALPRVQSEKLPAHLDDVSVCQRAARVGYLFAVNVCGVGVAERIKPNLQARA
eukprot:1361705-Rhodomonas_salina.1